MFAPCGCPLISELARFLKHQKNVEGMRKMVFSLQMALDEFFGGDKIWYGGTGSGGQITGTMIGGGSAAGPADGGATGGTATGGTTTGGWASQGSDPDGIWSNLFTQLSTSYGSIIVTGYDGWGEVQTSGVAVATFDDESWLETDDRSIFEMLFDIRHPIPQPPTWPGNGTWPGGPAIRDWEAAQAENYYTSGYYLNYCCPEDIFSGMYLEDLSYFWTRPQGQPQVPPPATSTPADAGGVHKAYLLTHGTSTSVTILETTYGGAGNDLVTGNGVLLGGAGDDTLVGGSGNDCLIAGTGNNMLEGGKGADTLDGSDGWGVADYHHAATAVTINLDGSGNAGDEEAVGDVFINVNGVQGSHSNDTLNGNANANWMIGDAGNDTLSGGGGNDTLYGSDGDDQLIGGSGDDYLIGGTGNNVLEGGAGADTLDGGDGWGVADYRNAAGSVTIHLDNTGNAGDQAASDVFINVNGVFGSGFGDTLAGNDSNNWMLGCGGNDWVSGGRGDDTLYGSEGNDTLVGGVGSDTLTGESGQDVFRFDTILNAASNCDRITDFSIHEDRIQLDGRIFAALASGPLATSSFAIGVAVNAAQHILYNGATGDLSYDVDGSGGQAAVVFANAGAGIAFRAEMFFVT